jgi:hypothetical protein
MSQTIDADGLRRLTAITVHPVDEPVAPRVPGDKSWVRLVLLLVTGCAALAIGILVYLADRAAPHAVLIPGIATFSDRPLFGTFGQWLPSFVHPLAFSLFTAAALKPTVAARIGAGGFWGAVNVAFEVGQHPAFSAQWAAALQGGAGDWAISRSLLNYFLHGTFDPYDVCAALLGAAAAGSLLHFIDTFLEARHAPNGLPQRRSRRSRGNPVGHRDAGSDQHRR